MKTLEDVTFAPGTAEGLERVNWEDLGHLGRQEQLLRVPKAVESLGQFWAVVG